MASCRQNGFVEPIRKASMVSSAVLAKEAAIGRRQWQRIGGSNVWHAVRVKLGCDMARQSCDATKRRKTNQG